MACWPPPRGYRWASTRRSLMIDGENRHRATAPPCKVKGQLGDGGGFSHPWRPDKHDATRTRGKRNVWPLRGEMIGDFGADETSYEVAIGAFFDGDPRADSRDEKRAHRRAEAGATKLPVNGRLRGAVDGRGAGPGADSSGAAVVVAPSSRSSVISLPCGSCGYRLDGRHVSAYDRTVSPDTRWTLGRDGRDDLGQPCAGGRDPDVPGWRRPVNRASRGSASCCPPLRRGRPGRWRHR